MKIANGLATKSCFANYVFIDDMRADGIKNAIEYIHNFDPEKSTNPFAYFTQIIYFAFIRRIDKEKKYLYTKYQVMNNTNLFEATSGRHEYDTYDQSYNDMIKQSSGSVEYMHKFIENYENRKNKKKDETGDSTSGNSGLDNTDAEPDNPGVAKKKLSG